MLRQNIFANFIGRAWAFISVYLFVPLYLRYLGIEAYGLVGFYSTLLGIMAFADMGFTATLNREMARLSVSKNSASEMRNLLRTYESTYGFISLFISLLVWLLAPLIAEKWLRSNVLQPHEITLAIRLMGVAIALQLPSGLFISGLMGLQRQVLANFLQIAWGLLRGLGAVLVLWLYSPTIIAFAGWQILSNGVYCILARIGLWQAISFGSGQPEARFRWQVFRDTWRYATGMFSIAVVSSLLKQADKLVVSKMLPLEMLGYYTLAGAVAAAPLTLASPIASAVFPRLTAMVAIHDRDGLVRLYFRTSELIAAIIIPAGLTFALFSGDFIFAWTGSASTAQRAGLVAALLVGGQTLQAITIVPYYLSLAHGNVRFPLHAALFGLILITPLLFVLVMKYGLLGAGLSWFSINIFMLPPYMYLVHRRFLPGEFRRWCWTGVGRPLVTGLPCVLLGYWIFPRSGSRLLTFCIISFVWLTTSMITILVSSELRQEARSQIIRLFSWSCNNRGNKQDI